MLPTWIRKSEQGLGHVEAGASKRKGWKRLTKSPSGKTIWGEHGHGKKGTGTLPGPHFAESTHHESTMAPFRGLEKGGEKKKDQKKKI